MTVLGASVAGSRRLAGSSLAVVALRGVVESLAGVLVLGGRSVAAAGEGERRTTASEGGEAGAGRHGVHPLRSCAVYRTMIVRVSVTGRCRAPVGSSVIAANV